MFVREGRRKGKSYEKPESDPSVTASSFRDTSSEKVNESGRIGKGRLGRETRGKGEGEEKCEMVSQPQSELSTCATSSKDTSSDENDSESDVVCLVCKFLQ